MLTIKGILEENFGKKKPEGILGGIWWESLEGSQGETPKEILDESFDKSLTNSQRISGSNSQKTSWGKIWQISDDVFDKIPS